MNFSTSLEMKRSFSEESDENADENPYAKLLKSLGVESSSESSHSELIESGEEQEDEEEEQEEEQEDQQQEEEHQDQDVDQDDDDDDEDQREDQEEDDVIEPVNFDKESLATFADENDPFRLIFGREYEPGELPKLSKGKHKTVGKSGAYKVSSTVALIDANQFISPTVNDWSGKSELQKLVFNAFGSYCDAMICGIEGVERRAEMRDMAALHIVNHVVKSRNKIWAGNCLLRKDKSAEVRDQGFSRCKVLILTAMRGDCYDIVRRLMSFAPSHLTVEGLAKFEEMCAAEDVELKKKPQDYVDRFSLNTDDSFAFGIRFNYENIRLCTGFGTSDVIIASALGLTTLLGDDLDVLSSLEVLLLDSAEVLQFQNWSLIESLTKRCNCAIKHIGEADISRLQSQYLNTESKFLRQTIAISEIAFPDLNSFFRRFCFNPRSALVIPTYSGVLKPIASNQSRHVFQKVAFSDIAKAAEERVVAFANLLNMMIKSDKKGILVFVPNYFDFLKLRKHLNEMEVSFAHICEYTDRKESIRDFKDFKNKVASVLLYTERRHFYHRSRIAGVEHVIFFGLPSLQRLYVEMLMLIKAKIRSEASIIVLYNELDKLSLERVVGTERCKLLLESGKKTHMFVV